MKNLSNISDFSESELGSLRLWDIPAVNISEDGELLNGRMRKVTVEEIEAMQKQAYDEAFAQGQKEGFQKGFDTGSKKGYEENLHLLQKRSVEFVQLMESLSEPFKALDEEVEKELVKLATAVAVQIVRREIKMDPGQVVAAVKESIKVLPLSSQKIYLRLHPEDAELVRTVLSPAELSPPWSVIEDPLITRGGCKVDTEISHIDASIENRLAAVISTIFGGERQGDKSL